MVLKESPSKCIICNTRPASAPKFRCAVCQSQIEADQRRRQKPKPEKYFVYRGAVVGLFRNGGDRLVAKALNRNPLKLPKGRTLNLDTYLPGYTREQIKAFKAAVKAAYAVKI